jgi:hypothetical protein
MAFIFDGPSRIISLTPGTTELDLIALWDAWMIWLLTDDNSKYPFALKQSGGEIIDLAQGIKIPIYLFLQNNWMIRPQEANHTLTVFGGILIGPDGQDPFIDTLGTFRVNTRYSQPVQAIAVATGGSGGTSVNAGIQVWNKNLSDPSADNTYGALVKNLPELIAQLQGLVSSTL